MFNSSELVVGINVKGGASLTRKRIDSLISFVQTPQVGAKGLVYCKFNEDGTTKSSVDKFFNEEIKKIWKEKANCNVGDLLLMMSGDTDKTRKALGTLRLKLAEDLNMRNPEEFAPLWVVDFPLLEWDEESERYHEMHHPFTAPK